MAVESGYKWLMAYQTYLDNQEIGHEIEDLVDIQDGGLHANFIPFSYPAICELLNRYDQESMLARKQLWELLSPEAKEIAMLILNANYHLIDFISCIDTHGSARKLNTDGAARTKIECVFRKRRLRAYLLKRKRHDKKAIDAIFKEIEQYVKAIC